MVDLIYEQAKEKLYDKMSEELQAFRSSLLKLTTSEIISDYYPYELIYKEDILMCFEDEEMTLSYADIKLLLKMDKPLDWLYQSWCESSVSHMEILRDFISNTVKTQEVS